MIIMMSPTETVFGPLCSVHQNPLHLGYRVIAARAYVTTLKMSAVIVMNQTDLIVLMETRYKLQ